MKELERVTSAEGLLNQLDPRGRKQSSTSYGFQEIRQDDNNEEARFDDEEPLDEDGQLLIDDAIGTWRST